MGLGASMRFQNDHQIREARCWVGRGEAELDTSWAARLRAVPELSPPKWQTGHRVGDVT